MDSTFFEAVFTSLPFGICIVDDEGRILGGNAWLESTLGWQIDSQQHKSLSHHLEAAISDPAQLLSWLVAVDDTLSRARTIYLNLPVEFRTGGHDPSAVSVMGMMSPWQIPQEGQAGALIVFFDRANHADLEGIRTRFLSVVAHELGSPLANIVAAVDQLSKHLGNRGAQEDRLLEIARGEADRLGRMLKQSLSTAPILAESCQPTRDVIALRPLIRKVVFTFRVRDTQRKFEVQVPPDLPYAWGNADSIQEVLCNLVDNALRHTPPGTSVAVSAEKRGNHVLVRVADRGMGLADQDQSDIFRPSSPRTQEAPSIEGQGLGLPIARALIARQGGQLWHEVPPGGGTAFCFTLPCLRDTRGDEANEG